MWLDSESATTNKWSNSAQSEVQRLEGFTIHEWAEYARRKACIATKVCRENGKLKSTGAKAWPRDVAPPGDGEFQADPVFEKGEDDGDSESS